MPKVSVILTTYNRPAMLRRAVESVLAQTFPDFELLVFDDNSGDPEQRAYLERLERSGDPRIRVWRSDVRNEDRSKLTRYAVLCNKGLLEIAEGEYVSYLCDDDYFLPMRLERMVARMNPAEDVHAVYGSQKVVELVDGHEEARGVREAVLVNRAPDCSIDHSSVMHTRESGIAVGGWETGPEVWSHGDGVFFQKLADAGFAFHPISEILDAHTVHPGSWTRKIGAYRPEDEPQTP